MRSSRRGWAEVAARAPDYVWDRIKEGYVGVIIANTGDCRVYDYTGRRVDGPTGRSRMVSLETGRELTLVRIGDTLQTTADGRMRIELSTWDGSPNSRPSVINMSINTTMVFDSMEWGDDERPSSWVSLIRGAIRAFFRGVDRTDSDAAIVRITGGTTCGIRGSDVFIFYDPRDEKVAASVLDGHMDVTDSRTGKTNNLTALQSVVLRDGEFGKVHPFTEEQWSSMVKSHGLEDMQGLSPEEREALWSQATPPTTSAATTTTSFGQTSVTSGGTPSSGPGSTFGTRLSGGMLALIIVLAVVVAAAIGVGVILLRRRRQRANEVAALPVDGAVASSGFCRHCGSAITPGSTFCGGCGKRL